MAFAMPKLNKYRGFCLHESKLIVLPAVKNTKLIRISLVLYESVFVEGNPVEAAQLKINFHNWQL